MQHTGHLPTVYLQRTMNFTVSIRLHPPKFWHRAPCHAFYRALLYSPRYICKTPQRIHASRQFSTQRQLCYSQRLPNSGGYKTTIRENIYTLPNILTVSRILSCPVLGWSILEGNFHLATSLLVYAGLTDLVCLMYFWASLTIWKIPQRLMGFWLVVLKCNRSLEQSLTLLRIRPWWRR